MKRLGLAALAALLVASAAPAPAWSADAPAIGRWSIASRADDASRVSLRLDAGASSATGSWSTSWSSTVPLADTGIPADRLRGPIGPVAFSVPREPGTFACIGSAGEGSGAGQFTYAPNARFDDALAARGMGRPSLHESLELAIAGTTLAFVDRLRAGSPHANVAEVVRVVQHGVSPRYIAELAALGYNPSLDDVARLRDHGVTPDLIRSVQQAGYRNLTPDDLVRLADHGVREHFIAEMRAAGYTKVTADQLITLRDHGVTPSYVGQLAATGYKGFSTEEIVALRDHGVSASFVARLKAHGYTNLSVPDLIRLRDAGI